jgi:hypothetical protein
MYAKSLILGCALLVPSVGCAQAGPCTNEIDSLTKTLAARDAGAGPTSGTAGIASQAPNVPIGQTGTMDGSAALARAKDMDQQGKESECMDALREAKSLSGAR